jgi:hypothetical protein
MPTSVERAFTIVCDFRGGTYVSQVRAVDEVCAVREWAHYLRSEKPILRVSGHLAKQVEADLDDFPPVALQGLNGVWCIGAICGRSYMSANIVESALAR